MIYFTKNGRDGILCALYESFTQKESPSAVYSSSFAPVIGEEVKEIIFDKENADRVKNGIIKHGGISLLSALFYPLRSYSDDKETVVFKAAERCLNMRKNVLDNFSDKFVLRHYELTKQISYEVHRMEGFLRFEEAEGGYYARFTPDNDIIDLVAPHFKRRFSDEKFIIHDIKRNKLCFFDGEALHFLKPDKPVTVYLTANEQAYSSLWKKYFKAVSITERKNERLQDNWLPRRYRANMSEFSPPENFN